MTPDDIDSSPSEPPAAALAEALDSEPVSELLGRASLPRHYLHDLRKHVAPLVGALERELRSAGRGDRPMLVGLNGCQGSGKSTLAQFVAMLLRIGAGRTCAVVSLDDFYLGRSARRRLAKDVHPLLQTRGVPGTHDLALADDVLGALLDTSRETAVHLPVFDKATDDHAPQEKWPRVNHRVDLVLFEGWCVGCPPQHAAELAEPVNALERDEDPQGIWRGYVNDALAGGYAELFGRLDRLVLLQAPGFDCVYRWRRQQERQLAENLTAQRAAMTAKTGLMDAAGLRRFIHHFERLTRHQLRVLDGHADAAIDLDHDHRMVSHRGRLFA